jgi:hypothetical protein
MGEEKREPMFASFSAKAIAAIAPMIRSVENVKTELLLSYAQVNTDLLGTYLVPAEKGAFIICVDGHRVLAIKDETAKVKAPFKVNLPNKILRLCKVKTVTLTDVNGEPIYAECKPKPDRVIFTDITCIVGCEEWRDKPQGLKPDEQENWEEGRGILGGFETGRSGNYTDYRKYVADPATHLEKVLAVIRFVQEKPPQAMNGIALDFALLKPLAACAESLDLQYVCQFYGDEHPVEVTSVKADSLYCVYGLVMPLKRDAITEVVNLSKEILRKVEVSK